MKRRDAIHRISAILGGTILGADSLLARQIDWEAIEALPEGARIGLFSGKQIRLLNEIAETILPETGTPGAKAAKVGQFMAVIVSDCFEDDEQQIFLNGLNTLQENYKKQYGKPYQRCIPKQRTEFLAQLDAEQKAYYKNRKAGDPPHYFRQIKDLTLWGYFTSEIGATQALRMVEVPGRYEGCVPYAPGDRAWGG